MDESFITQLRSCARSSSKLGFWFLYPNFVTTESQFYRATFSRELERGVSVTDSHDRFSLRRLQGHLLERFKRMTLVGLSPTATAFLSFIFSDYQPNHSSRKQPAALNYSREMMINFLSTSVLSINAFKGRNNAFSTILQRAIYFRRTS